MTRTEEREQACVLIFEKEFNMDTSMDDIISYAAEADVFFDAPAEPEYMPHPVLTELTELNPDQLTPRQALDFLYQLKDKL